MVTSSSIRIVLIDTSHPGNIGATARAMKNMGLGELTLVRPKEFPSEEATARASGAEDVLQRARVVQTLDEAIADCALIVGATARPRGHYWQVFDVRKAARKVVEASGGQPVAVMFGSEKYGLNNEELTRCNWLIRIPANPEYDSLNLAQAVQIVCYELFMARGAGVTPAEREAPLATAEQMEHLYKHLEEVMEETDFRDRTRSGTHLMGRLRRLFSRAELDQNEANILRGLLTAVQSKRRQAGQS